MRAFLIGLLLLAALPTLAGLSVSVWPQKLRVKPGEPQVIQVTVAGLPAGQTATVDGRVITGLNNEVAKFTGTTDTKGVFNTKFTPKAPWGYTVEATARAGNETATGTEIFLCARNPYLVATSYAGVAVYGQDVLPDGTPAPAGAPSSPGFKQQIADQVAFAHKLYLPVVELVGPAFCSFSSIKPPVDNYFKGFHYNYSRNGVRGLVDALHDNGISSVIYVNACLSGLAGTEFARQHPEYLAYNSDGTPTGSIDLKTMALHQWYVQHYPESLRQVTAWRKQQPQPEQIRYSGTAASLQGDYPGFLNALLNFTDPKLAELGAKFILEGQAYFGYDGVRFDGDYAVPAIGDPLAPASQIMTYQGTAQPTGKKAEALTARNMVTAYALLRAKNPDFLIGVNNASFRNDQLADRMYTYGSLKALAPGNWVLDEVAKGALNPSHPEHHWADFIAHISDEADRLRKVDDYFFAGWGGSPGVNPVDTRQILAIAWACGARWVISDYRKNLDVVQQYNRFSARYGEFIINNKLQRLSPAEVGKCIQVTGNRPLLWQKFAYRLQTASGRYLVLHLVNQPLEDVVTTEAKEPPVAENVQVTVNPGFFPGVPQSSRAMVLSPDTVPQAQPAGATLQGGKLTLAIPNIAYWAIVVVPY
ncbi:MAG TPA: hypothetical protein VGM23_01815 [Armatimonadota bacterium]